MKIKNEKILSLFLFFLNLFVIKSEVKIYPDHNSPGDPIFNNSQVYSKTNERFFYFLGYYTNNPAQSNLIESKKYGIYYEPVACTPNTLNYNPSDTTTFESKVIKNIADTRNKKDNYFEEIELFRNVLTGSNFECPSRLKVIHDINLKITYIIPVISSNTKFSLDIKISDTESKRICDVKLNPNELKTIQIDIKTEIENILNQEVTMVFRCTDAIINTKIKLSGKEDIIFIFNKEYGEISISNFRITVEDITTKTGSKSNKLLDRSKLGLKGEENCQNSNDCFRGHICNVNHCNPCHYSCIQCHHDESSSIGKSSCIKCNTLTIDSQPLNGKCPINYIDLSQFKDINVEIMPYGDEFNDRATIGLWLFFSDLSNSRSLTNDIYHIVLVNRMVISVVPWDNIVTAYCHTYEDLYRKVTSDTTLESSYYDKNSQYVASITIPSEDQLNKMDIETMNGKWFHISCGMSFDHEKFYLKSVVNGVSKIEQKPLNKERLYPGSKLTEEQIKNDMYFNHIINEGEYLILKLKNFGNSNAKIYARHLIFFKEYIDTSLQYMYFDFKDVKDYKEILYQIPFDELIIDQTYKVKGYQYDNEEQTDKIESYITLEISHSETLDFYPALNFYRLFLNAPNKTYKYINLKNIPPDTSIDTGLVGNENSLYLYDDNKVLNCKNKHFFNQYQKECSINEYQCDNNYLPFPGIAKKRGNGEKQTTGYCDNPCTGSLTCDLTLNAESDFDYNGKFCDNTNAYNLFYKCIEYIDNKNYYLQFSGFYNTQTIELKNLKKSDGNPLNSYIIEFWFYPDYFLRANARVTQFTYPTYTKNFFFHSNVIDMYFSQTDRLVPYVYDSYKVIKITSIYNSNEWNNFIIYGKYYEDTQDFLKTVFVNHAFNYPFSFDLAKSSGTTSLQSITFCENKCQDLQNENIHWTTGYYRDIRIWDGDMASYSQIIQYDNLYGDFIDRINSILYHFPFSNQYISNNQIVDKKYPDKKFELKTGGVYFLKKYNYCSKFDIIESSEKKKYCKHASDPAFIDDCDIGCERCWERTFCYKCITNYYLSGRKCLPENDNFFFRNPAKNRETGDIKDIVLSYSDNHAFTLCFWTKPIGFSNEIQKIITYGSANPIQLSYSSNINNRYGLSLLGNKASDNLIGIQKEFRDNIGKWTFISIAYHKEIKEGTETYFPKMIKFEINTESIQADTDKIGDDPIFNRIIIDKGYFGLFGGIKHYNQYIIQAIAYEDANQPYNLSPFTIPIPDIQLSCSSKYYTESPSNNKYPCFPDEKPDIGLFVDSCSLYKDTLKTEDSCMNFCSGNGWERCNCFATNHNSQMIFNNNNKNLCRPLDYINFAKINNIRIPKNSDDYLSSAKSEKKCTLQFWMFAYPYINQRFQGITFDWEGHVKINLALKPSIDTSQDDEYIFTCDEHNGKSISTGSDDAPNIKLKQWVFLSCAVDYDQTKTIYLNYNTESDDLVLLEEEDVNGEISLENTHLTITDDTIGAYKEWGVLFFRQIRLWKDAYFNAEFLSRVFIETPSKFQHLLHSWEPVYKGYLDNYEEKNLKVYDIVSAKNFYVTYPNDYYSQYGMNVIDENYYNILKMCSEDGFYYDITLKTCLQFIDLSKMKDFSFKELPSSYSGNYAMAFWIFFEDTIRYKNRGLHLKWSRHLQITIQRTNSALTGFCFPQGYYSDYVDNDSNFEQKFSDALNKKSIPLLTSGPENGRWFYVMCSVSYYNRKFYIQSDDEEEEENIIAEDLFQSQEKTSYPMRFYLSDLNNNVMYKSTLSIINIDPERKIYLREILLFRNFIPFWYSQKFRYMNMRMLSDNQFPALLFAVNFAQFDLETKKLDYCYYERLYGSTYYQRVDTSMKLYEKDVGSTFELSANFRFQPLCDLSQISFKKYDVKNRTCIDMKDCTLSTIKAVYCMEENVPLICESGLALTIDNSVNPPKVICPDECLVNHESYSYLTPGTAGNLGICNSFCPEESKDSVSDDCTPKIRNMKCNPGYIKIGYKCIDESKNVASALFFSKCFNSPNFYRTISTSTLAKISSGYFYEFWMKLDNTLIQKYCDDAGTSSKEYYLYSTPHSIYKENDVNLFYYQIINSAYKVQMPAISRDKWNKIVIETSIDTTGQNVYVHTNFEKEILEILSVSPSISMRLQYISFCSRKEAGDCIPGSSNIMWGSAYYRNIRVWDIRSSSIYTIQDFNNGLYTEHPKSLVLYYPLDIKNMDNNIIKEIISGTDNIKVTHIYSNNFQTDDDVIDYNYETNLIWELAHECPIFENPEEKQVLVKKECIKVTDYYLKVPANTPVSLNIEKINTLKPEAYTICIYMKFIGIVDSSISAQPVMFLFKDDTFIVYDIATSYLIFYIGGSEIEAFRDINFHAYIGKWIPICIANFRSTEPYIHPHMITLSVNKIDIPFTSGYSIANNGIHLEKFTLGNEIIAYFSNFKVYTTFIQGNFANFIANEFSDKEILIDYELHCDDDKNSNCTVDDGHDFTDNSSLPCCVGDYNIYENATLWCTDGKTNYFDVELPNDKTCNGCNEYCKTKCYNSKDSECSCDMTETIYWLRKNKATSKTYCEHPEYIDYSLLNDFELKVPSSSTNESTIEFWFFIYSYNTTNINFKEINIIWNNHNKVQIINDKNSLSARCYALWDDDDDNPSKFSELVQTISVTAFTWTSIRCGTNINKPNYKHFFNTYEKTISVKEDYLPYNRNKNPSLLKINGGNLNPISYGFLFIRELKLWQQYNVNYIDTSYIRLDEVVSVLTYDNEAKRSIGAYPGLITLIRSEFKIDSFEDAREGKYHIKNLVIPEDSPFPKEAILTRNNDHYYGYNLIDPTNADYYKKLVLCEEGYVYNSLFNYCEKPSYTKCLQPGDVKDNCIRCPEESKYIHPIDGLCKSECPTGYYKRDDMNQCRPCNETCYKCNWTFGFNCLECIGDRYLVPAESMCVKKCEEFNLTASAIINNMCTEFFANASIINYDIREYIDLNTFYRLVGKVTNYTSRGYTVKWSFDREETIKSNNFPVNLPQGSPFIGKLDNEKEVLINNSFFQLNTNYSVVLTVIAHNILYYNSTVEYPIHFLLMINPRPLTELYIFPIVGLYKTTYFVMRCQNSNDTFPYIGNKNLQYRFFAKEDNVYKPRPYLLRGWSIENEVTTNFFDIETTDNTYKIDIFCEIRDDLNASRNTSPQPLYISKSLSGGLYDLEYAIFVYKLPLPEDDERKEYDVLLYHRSQHLLSLCIDLYKTVHPERLQTEYESSLDGTEIKKNDPRESEDYCNYKGDTIFVDEFFVCRCNNDSDNGWTGKYCHIKEKGEPHLKNLTEELFGEIMGKLEDKISWYYFMGVYNLFKASSLFDETDFFSRFLSNFFYIARNSFSDSIANNTMEYLDILDFYYSYEKNRMEKIKAEIKVTTNSDKINFDLSSEEMEEFEEIFTKKIEDEILTFMQFLANQNSITRRSIIYTSENYYLAVVPVNPSFDDEQFFQDRKSQYRTYIEFMSCLNYIEMDKFANPYYQGYFLYIEFKFFLFGYNNSYLYNNTSPLIEMKFIDSTTGKEISVTGCERNNQIIIHMPFTNANFLEEFNYQKLLYDPHIYKSPDDPIFSDPVYIEENGMVSDDTIEQRIEKYSRRYNISPRYYDTSYKRFDLDGINYINFTNDKNFIVYGSNHLCKFTTFIIPNNATYHPNGRFYYLARPRILKYFPNYYQSYGSLIFLVFLVLYFIYMIICICYDSQFTNQEDLLNYIKEEIVKNFYPYAKNKKRIVEKLIPTKMNVDFQPEIKFGPNAKVLPKDRILSTLNEGKISEKERILTLNKSRNKNKNNDDDEIYSEENEDEKSNEKATSNRKLKNQKVRRKLNNFMKEKPLKIQKKINEETKKNDNDDYESEIDRELGNVNRATFTINYLPKDFEKSKEEKERRLENYSHLKMTSGQFFSANYKLRTTLINSLCNVSLFQPRWKKLTMFVTEIGLMILVISILLTIDEKAKLKNGLIIIGYLFAYGLAASTFSNLVMYCIALSFHFPKDTANRLYKLVLFNGQLIVLKEWEEISFAQGIKAIPGIIFCVIFWLISLYVGLGFTAVWNDQNFEFLISFAFAFVLNFFIMELIVEGIIAIFYIGRKKYNCTKKFGYFLNRLRNYRCLSS